MRDDEDVILWAEDLPPLIPPDEYDAVCLSARKVKRFNHWLVEFRFRLVTEGQYFNIELHGYCTLGASKSARIRPGSKLASWMRAIADFTGESPSRVTLRAFRHYWFRVKVETVTKDNQQRERHPRDQYSAVEDLVTVVGKISEVPTASSRDLTS